MGRGPVEVIGVHPILWTEELVQQSVQDKWGLTRGDARFEEAAMDARDELSSTVLIELVITAGAIQVADLSQAPPEVRGPEDQAPWWERYLSRDGTSVLAELDPVDDNGAVRIAFFLHYFDPDRPLYAGAREIELPQLSPIPPRLASLCPYVVPD